MRKAWRALLLAAGAAAVAAVVYFNNPAQILVVASKAEPRLLAAAVGFELLSMLLFGLAWHELLKALSLSPSLGDSLKASLISLFGDITIPSASISGEFMRVAYASNKMSVPTGKAVASVTVHRFLYTVSFVVLLVAGAVVFGLSPSPFELLYALAAGGGLAFLVLLASSPRRASRLVSSLLHKLPVADSYAERAAGWVSEIAESLAEMGGSKKRLATAFAALIAQWMSGAAGQLAVFYSLGYTGIAYPVVLAIYPIYVMLTVSSVGIPGSLGVVETGMSLAYMAVGVPRPVAVAAVLLSRALTLSTDLAVTFTVFLRESQHIRIPGPR